MAPALERLESERAAEGMQRRLARLGRTKHAQLGR